MAKDDKVADLLFGNKICWIKKEILCGAAPKDLTFKESALKISNVRKKIFSYTLLRVLS